MEAVKIILAGVGCLGLLIVGSCTMLGMAGAQMVNKAVELQKQEEAKKTAHQGVDSSRFSARASNSYDSVSSDYKNRTAMDNSEWKFGDPNADVSKR